MSDLLAQHERNRKALLFITTAMESGSDLSEIDWGIYENIKLGLMECDETGRSLRLTQAGQDEVRSLGSTAATKRKIARIIDGLT
jgi:hypothetical protein